MPSCGETRGGASGLDYAFLVRALDEAIRLSGPARWTPLDDLEAQRIESFLVQRGIHWNPYIDTRGWQAAYVGPCRPQDPARAEQGGPADL